jgi:dihydrodipicolinate synthase/N-acetylneuraminate lyase
MPAYYIYRINQGPTELVKALEKIDQFEGYKDAKKQVKQLRIDQPSDDNSTFKIVFAENELAAEEMLMAKREAPVMAEWEK